MHPVIRVVSLVVVAVGLSRPTWPHLTILLPALGLLSLRSTDLRVADFGKPIWRLRYLFLSVLVLYFWFTPGSAVIPGLGAWSPSWHGVEMGVQRTLALILLISAVRLLVLTTDRGLLLAALCWLLRPFGVVGLDPQRFALRMVLTMEAVPRLAELVAARRGAAAGTGALARMANFAGEVFAATLAEAEAAGPQQVRVPRPGPPPAAQWLLPGMFVLAFIYI